MIERFGPHGRARRLLVGNWKMNLSLGAARSVCEQLACRTWHSTALALAVPAVWIMPLAQSYPAGSPLVLGAQNVYFEKSGAFTGEISVSMLRECGAGFALAGHSERRHVFYESDQLAAQRAVGALEQDFQVIFCIGETLSERDAGCTFEVLARQLSQLLQRIKASSAAKKLDAKNLIVAYEPVWAIGTGRAAEIADIAVAHAFIDSKLKENGLGEVPLLYGGSVSAANIGAILSVPQVHGALIGKASLEAASMIEMAEISEKLNN